MNFPDWMDATSARVKGLLPEERQRRMDIRRRVTADAGTTENTLRNAKSRGIIGTALLRRLVDATQCEAEQVDLSAEMLRQEAARKAC